MKDKKLLVYISIVFLVIMAVVISFSYAYLAATQTIGNNLNVNVTFASGTVANFTVTGNTNIALTINGKDMLNDNEGNAVANTSKTVKVSLKSDLNVTCSYSLVWRWLSNTDNYEKSITEQNEFVVSGTATGLSMGEVNVPYTIEGSMVLGRYKISANATTTTQTWTIRSKFYNLNVIQDQHANKTYRGQVAVDDAHCYPTSQTTLANKIISNAGSTSTNTGTDEQGNKWSLFSTSHTSDSKTDYRYAGANPSNYILFNGEMWRIIGVMPVDYDNNGDGIPETNGNLVKIIRNTVGMNVPRDYKLNGLGSSTNATYGSNEWSDSQLMVLLNPLSFLNSGYTSTGTIPWKSYVRGEYVYDRNGVSYYRNPSAYWNLDTSYAAYTPASTTKASGFTSEAVITRCSSDTAISCFRSLNKEAQGMIATVKWPLGGYSSAALTPESFYEAERTVNASTTRAAYWYGKVGLMYASDVGYAAYGSNDSTYPKTSCMSTTMSTWNSGDPLNYCAKKSFLRYNNASNTSQGSGSSTITMTPKLSHVFYIALANTNGNITDGTARGAYVVRPVLYLNPNTVYVEGDGTYTNPYRIL